MVNSKRLKIYNDIRDDSYKFDENILFLNERKKYSKERNKIRFLLFNDIDTFFYSKRNVIKYIKICHIIKAREVFVYELINIKKFETLEVLLNRVDENEEEELYLIYFVDEKKRYFKDLSKLYGDLLKYRKDDIAHFHFKNGNVNKIVPYFMYNGKFIYLLIIFLLFLILLFGTFFVNCSNCIF